MSNYTKSTNFATKDNLTPGDPLKVVRGTEIDTEFNNISTAIATKTDNSAAAITGGSITGITDLAIADGGTGASTATAAINNLLPAQTSAANKYLQSDGTNVSWDAVTLSTADITGTLPVANGGTGVTSSTGTGSVVLSNSPTLVTPALGTPASGVATNLTGLPISTGVSGLGTGVATFLGTPSSANLASAVSDETGSGALVFANSPTLVTPALGTPSALVGTNITGTASGLTAGNVTTNANLTGAVTSVGNATALGSFSSANLLGALTDETGTGSAVFATSPTLVTPILGTPTSATLTNATGLPISTGVSGLGTGIATALAVNTGSAGAPVLFNGALGTPSSGTLTNATGLPNAGLVNSSITIGGTAIALGASSNALANDITIYGVTVGRGGGAVSTNTAVGASALVANTTGVNTAIGYQAAYNNVGGTFNTHLGAFSGFSNVSGNYNSYIGRGAGYYGTGGSNTVVGYAAYAFNSGAASSGSNNTALGYEALTNNTTASNNTAVGYQAGYSASVSAFNTFIGYQAGYSHNLSSAGNGLNTFIGQSAGYNVTTGTKNTYVGTYNGNQGGLNLSTESNYVVLSDGDGNPLILAKASSSLSLQGATPQTGTGITFPATQSASSNANTLDDYEEGTWTPELVGGTTAGTPVPGAGYYTKVGNLVTIFYQFEGVATPSGAAGVLYIRNMPFQLNSATIIYSYNNPGLIFTNGATSLANMWWSHRIEDATGTRFGFQYTANANNAPVNLEVTNLGGTGNYIRGYFSYQF